MRQGRGRAAPHGPAAADHRLQLFADRLKPLYLLITLALALLAYAYVFAFPLLTMVFMGRAMAFALAGDFAGLGTDVALAMACATGTLLIHRVRPQPPQHVVLPESNAMKLRELIEEVRVLYGAPPVHEVQIGDDTDVRLVYTPISGYPILNRRTLVIGLAAMQLLSPLHFRALLARRIGQSVIRGHALTWWLALLRQIGPALLGACPSWRRPECVLVRVFFLWYVPLYNRWSAPVARLEELAADRAVMRTVNDRDVAETMAAQVVAERYLRESYFPSLFRLARDKPNPPPIAFEGLERKFNRYWSAEQAKRWLAQAYRRPARELDPCPPLRRRLAEIGHSKPRLPSPLRECASRLLLGVHLKSTLLRQDGAWMRRVLPRWQQVHREAKRELQRLRSLHKKYQRRKLDLEESRELAGLVERCFGKHKAAPFYKQMLLQNPGDANVSFAAGRFLLSANDPQGITALRRAILLDQRFEEPATGLIETFEQARGTSDAA